MRISDWSSDVCSSDLIFGRIMHQNAILQAENDGVRIVGRQECALGGRDCQGLPPLACDANENTVETAAIIAAFLDRSAERRVGKECVCQCGCGWDTYNKKKNVELKV